MLTAIFKPASFALVLMLRLLKEAARSSAITASTVGREKGRGSRVEGRGEEIAALAFMTAFIQRRICRAQGTQSMQFAGTHIHRGISIQMRAFEMGLKWV